MGYQLLEFNQQVPAFQDERYRTDPAWMGHIMKTASRALAEKIMGSAGKLYTRIDPEDPEDVCAKVIHRVRVGVELDPAELRARQNDMDTARREGMEMAAKMLREAASAYDRVDGHCRHVLKYTMLEQADLITKKANEL